MSRQGASLEELEDRLVKAKQQHDAASMGIKALQTLNKVGSLYASSHKSASRKN